MRSQSEIKPTLGEQLMTNKTWLIPTLTTLFIMTGCSKAPEPAPVDVVRPVKVMTLESFGGSFKRKFPGRVQASERLEMAFQVGGKLNKLNAKKGDTVKKGDLLAQLDLRDFRSTVHAAQASFDESKSNFERAKELIKDGFISKSDYDRVKANFERATSDLEKASKALDDATLKAPFSGQVAQRFVENFEEIKPGQPILRLQDVTTLEIIVDAPERLIAQRRQQIPANLKISVRFDAAPNKEIPLKLKEFSTIADPKTQTFEYVMVLQERPKGINILPGMTATVSLIRPPLQEEDTPQVFTIPALSVFANSAGESQVWIIDNETNTAQARTVVTGSLTGTDSIQILSGLTPGETIAIAGVSQIRDGMTVRPVTEIQF